MRQLCVLLVLTVGLGGAVRAQDSLPSAAVTGRRIVLQPLRVGGEIRGELLSARGDSAWVLERSSQRVVAVRLGDIRSADVQRHGLTAGKGLLWGGVVGALSGIGLAAACSKVSDGCGAVFVGSLAAGLLWGGLSALSLGPSSKWHFEPPTADSLARFARFPQGPPPGMRDSLAARPAAPLAGATP